MLDMFSCSLICVYDMSCNFIHAYFLKPLWWQEHVRLTGKRLPCSFDAINTNSMNTVLLTLSTILGAHKDVFLHS